MDTLIVFIAVFFCFLDVFLYLLCIKNEHNIYRLHILETMSGVALMDGGWALKRRFW